MALYRPAATSLHRLNPAGKIVLLVLFFIAVLRLQHPPALFAALAVALLGVALGRAWAALRAVLPLLLTLAGVTLLFWALFGGGSTPLWRLGTFTLHREAVVYGAVMALRLVALLLGGLVLIATTSVEALRWGLCRLRVPFPVAFAIGLAFRLIPHIAGALEKAVQAQRCRGFAVDAGGPLTRLHNYAPLLIPAILVSLRTTDQLAAALEGRGFGATIPRTSLHAYPWRAGDTLCLVVLTAAVAASWVWTL